MRYRVVSIPPELAQEVRATRKSPQYGHPAHSEVAKGYGPCRQCLRTFHQGEERRLLFTYNPFDKLTDYPSPGPVFIHESECRSFDEVSTFPPQVRELPLMFEAYERDRELLLHEQVVSTEIEPTISRLLAIPSVEYLHVRNREAGCYIARVERIPENETDRVPPK
jgi:Protein of unknown function (DUF1203)